MCMFESNVIVISRLENIKWLVKIYEAATFIRNDDQKPRHVFPVDNFKDIFKSILPGNAVAFYSGSVVHVGVCAGTYVNKDEESDPDGEPYIIHRNVETEKKLNPNIPGGIQKGRISTLFEESKLQEMKIYFCHPDVPKHMCCAAAVHKAFGAYHEKGYHLLHKNCENFAFYCCSFDSNRMSSQVYFIYKYIYNISATILFVSILIFGLIFGWALEIICLAYLAFAFGYFGCDEIFKRLMHKAAVRQFQNFAPSPKWLKTFSPSIFGKFYLLLENFLDREIAYVNIDHDQNDKIIDFKKVQYKILQKFYYICQQLNVLRSVDKSKAKQKLLEPTVAEFVAYYLFLEQKIIDELTNTDPVKSDIRAQDSILDLEIFALALSKTESKFITGFKEFACGLLISFLESISPLNIRQISAMEGRMATMDFKKAKCQKILNLIKTSPNVFQIFAYEALENCVETYLDIVLKSASNIEIDSAFENDILDGIAFARLESKLADPVVGTVYEKIANHLKIFQQSLQSLDASL